MVRIISIVSGKGGVGKTVLTANLAVALAQKFRKRVVLIDLNVTTSHLGIYLGRYNYIYTLTDFLKNNVPINNVVYNYYSTLEFIPSSLDLPDLTNVNFENLKNLLIENFSTRDFILVDGAPGLGREGLLSLNIADEVIFVSNPYLTSVVDIARCCKILNTYNVKPLGIVLNRIKRKKYELVEEEIKMMTGLDIIARIVEDEEVEKSVNLRVPVVILNEKSKASREIIRLAAFLSNEPFELKESFFEKILKVFR